MTDKYNDKYLTLIGALASIANGAFRAPISATLDIFKKWPFKKTYSVIIIMNIILAALFHIAVTKPGMYLAWCFFTMGCYGGQLAIWPPMSAKVFGTTMGSVIYGLFFYGFVLANVLQFLLVLLAKEQITFNGIMWVQFALNILTLICTWIFDIDKKYNWEPYHKKI